MSKKVKIGADQVKGFDLSRYQGKVDFKAAKALGFDFVFAKASDGDTSHDSTYKMHSEDARAAGVIVGAYHFFHFTKDPVKQMDSLIAAIGGSHKQGDLPPVIDVEWTDGMKTVTKEGSNNVLKALVYLEKKLGVTPIIYTSAAFFTDPQTGSLFKKYPLWVASYRTDLAVIPDFWDTFAFWQQTDHRDIPGYKEAMDGDVFNGTLAQLQALAGMTPAPQPVIPSTTPFTPPPSVNPMAPPAPAAAQGFFAKLIAMLKRLF